MPTHDPFAYLSQTKLSRETVASLEKEKPDPFAFLDLRAPPVFTFPRPEEDVGIGTAFSVGLKEGVLAPATVFGREAEILDLDETSEKVANFIGTLAGFGIGFYPFMRGVGLALRGVGLAKPLMGLAVVRGVNKAGIATESFPVFNFARNTLAGTAQFAGMAEELKDVPKEAAIGAVFGGVVEGFFLSRALRARGRLPAGTPDVPITGEHLGLEIEISPTLGKLQTVPTRLEAEIMELADMEEVFVSGRTPSGPTAPRQDPPILHPLGEVQTVATKARAVEAARVAAQQDQPLEQALATFARENADRAGLQAELDVFEAEYRAIQAEGGPNKVVGFTPAAEEKTLEQILVDLTGEHIETARIPRLTNQGVAETIAYAKARFPNAQILKRRVAGENFNEVLVHNPLNPEGRLTSKQIAQWQVSGSFENMAVVYGSRMHVTTGAPVAPGRIQLRSIANKNTVFTVAKAELADFAAPLVLNEASRIRRAMRQVLQDSKDFGFTVAAKSGGGLRRGVVDTTDYLEVTSLRKYRETNIEGISGLMERPAGGTEGLTVEQATREFAQSRNVKGLIIKEADTASEIHVFDQATVSYIKEPPRVDPGIGLDIGVIGANGSIESFIPSWQNAIAGKLRRRGFAEKDIRNFMERYTSEEANRLQEALLDPEFLAIKRASESQFFEGCL